MEAGGHLRSELPHRLEALDAHEFGDVNRFTVCDRHELFEHSIDDPLVFFEVLFRFRKPSGVALILFRPAPARNRALGGPHGDRRSVDAEEPFRRSAEYSVSAEIDVGAVATALGENKVAVELIQVAADGGVQSESVVHLLELIGSNEASNPPHVLLVLIFVHRRNPRRDGVRRCIHPGLSNEGGHLNPLAKQAKPSERQIRERFVLITDANGERSVERWSCVVGHEADRPIALPRCQLSLLENAGHLVEAVRRDLVLRIGEFHRSPAGRAELIESCVRH